MIIASYCELILKNYFPIWVEIIFPWYLSWNIDVDLCPYFKSPYAILVLVCSFSPPLCLVLSERDRKHRPEYMPVDTRNETRFSWFHWSLQHFWFLKYRRPSLSQLLPSPFFFPLTQIFSVSYPFLVPCYSRLVLQTRFVWSSFLGEQQRQEASRRGRISVCGALSCGLLSAHSQTAALPGQNPSEYRHQACNYPQVLLSRNHLPVAFYKALQHTYSEKLLVCLETLSSHKVLLSAPSCRLWYVLWLLTASSSCFVCISPPKGMMRLLLS